MNSFVRALAVTLLLLSSLAVRDSAQTSTPCENGTVYSNWPTMVTDLPAAAQQTGAIVCYQNSQPNVYANCTRPSVQVNGFTDWNWVTPAQFANAVQTSTIIVIPRPSAIPAC